MNVRYTKWGDRPHWHFQVEPLGRDQHGQWFGGRRGIRIQRADEPPGAQPHDFVMLVPDAGCYTAFWNKEGEVEVYVDVTTEPTITDHVFAAVDLDLDVIRRQTGTVELIDEDEFEDHWVRYGYRPGWSTMPARPHPGC